MQTAFDFHDWLLAVQEGRISGETAEADLIWKFVAAAKPTIKPGPFTALVQCEVCLAPFSFFNATPLRDRHDRGIMVLSHGLLDGMMAYLQVSYVLQSLPASLDSIHLSDDYPEISAKAWIAIMLTRLVYDHCALGEPLPNLCYLIHQDIQPNIGMGIFAGAIWTLLHELGHLQLGHLDGVIPSLASPSPEDFLVTDELRPYQQAELAADRFAFESYEPIAQQDYLAIMAGALAPQQAFESILSRRNDSHPLTLNRLKRAHGQTLEATGTDTFSHLLAGWSDQASCFVETEKRSLELRYSGVDPLLAGLTHQQIVSLIQGYAGLTRLLGVDLSRIFEPAAMRWTHYAEQLISSWLAKSQN